MFGQRVQNLATGKSPAVREARRENGKPRKQMPSQGVSNMGSGPTQESISGRSSRLDDLVDRMRQQGPPELPEPSQQEGPGSPVGTSLSLRFAVERLMRARAAAAMRGGLR